MTARVFHIRGVLAIPTGHRIEITTFALNVGMLKEKLEPRPYDPFIRDLVTGVVYARAWHYSKEDASDVSTLSMDVRSDLPVVERVIGQVRGARIVRGLLPDESGRHGYVTTLLVTVE